MAKQEIAPLSAATHYAKAAQFWENEAKRLQAIADLQDAELDELRKCLATYEPPDPSEAQQTEPNPAAT